MLLRFASPLLLGATALSVLLIGCKNDADTAPDAAKQLQHRWTWQQSTGGIAGLTETPASTGQQRAIEFDAKGNVRYYTDGQLTRTNTYTLQSGTSIRSDQTTTLIVYSNGHRQGYSIQGQQLSIWDEAYDGYSHEYHR